MRKRDAVRGLGFSASRRARRIVLATAIGMVLCAVFSTGSAGAAPVTVGSPLSATFTSGSYGDVLTVVDIALSEAGAHVASPVTGTVVRWRITGASGGPFYLVVLTPGGSDTATAISTGAVPAGLSTQTFTTDLPIKAGQTIGLNNSTAADTIGVASVSGSAISGFMPPLTPGQTEAPFASQAGSELGVNADVQPLPKVTKLSPRSASRKGGKKITIKGKNFDGTTAVMFGTKKAKKFKVISDTKITATAPAHKAGTVHVIVLNPGHSKANSASRFKFKKPAKH